jgi:hypothetical protein
MRQGNTYIGIGFPEGPHYNALYYYLLGISSRIIFNAYVEGGAGGGG